MRTIDNRLFFDEVAEQLALGHAVRIRARGNSMLPFIRDGRDVLVLEHPGERDFVRGQVLLAQLHDGRYVIHRVVKVKGDRLRLRGDGNLQVYEMCSRAEVLAEVTEVVRGERMLGSEALVQREQQEQQRGQQVQSAQHGQLQSKQQQEQRVQHGQSMQHEQRTFAPRSIRQGTCRWNVYRFLWPSHPFLRRVGLAIYRRMNKQLKNT